jgi:L,D-transpeptidase YcbB
MIKITLKYCTLFVAAVFSFAGCTGAETAREDTAIHASTMNSRSSDVQKSGYSDLYLDSAGVEQFIEKHGLSDAKAENIRDFYQSRDYQFAWFAGDGLDEHGQDSSLFDKELHRRMEVLVNDETEAAFSQEEVKELELSLTRHFFDYAKYAFTGSINPKSLKWYIPRKKINAVALLDSLVATNGEDLDEWEPVNQQYKQMRSALMRYYKIEKSGGWKAISGEKKVYKLGDSSATVQQIKERLRLSGDFVSPDTSAIFTPELKAAVQNAQRRFGLQQDGIAGPNTLRHLNKPVSDRIKQMLLNMERMRWMPVQGGGTRLVANIPEYKLHVYEGRNKVFDMRIVVGKAVHKTVVFNDKLKHIVFSPYWNVPASIVRNEILPAMRSNPGYLVQNNMEQTGTRNGLPVIRQKPGSNNSLGRVKFLFPNSYAIYFHDTPAKHLFGQDKRAFSHGCIRLEQPKRLAGYLLKDQPAWNESRISSAMYANSEKWVNVSKPVSVAITYFTSWVDEEGKVNFREDIYGHDKALAARLFN